VSAPNHVQKCSTNQSQPEKGKSIIENRTGDFLDDVALIGREEENCP